MLRWLICVQLQKCVRVLFYLTVHLFIFRQTCEENRSILTTSLKSVALCCQGCSLFCIVARFFQENASKLFKISDTGNSSEAPHEVESESLATADTAMFPPNLFAEWQEFFSSSLFNTVLRLFMFHAGESRVRRLVLSRGGEGREESVVVVVAVLFWGVGGGGWSSVATPEERCYFWGLFINVPTFSLLISSPMSKLAFWSLILVEPYRWVTW